MIQINGISFSIENKKILENITFDVPECSIFGLLGQNGAGKSTLIKIILGITKAHSGTITIDKYTFNEHTKFDLLKKMGSLIEQASLYDFLSPLENLELARRIYGVDKGYSEELLYFVGLEKHADYKVKTLSLGMKQRLGIALAMIGKPKLVILDEPTNGLDPSGLNEFRNLINKFNIERKTTFLISSHHLSELEKLVTHVSIIHKGISVHTSEVKNYPSGTLNKLYFELTK
jgi:ABC-2 type transport system ATP-binding protein